jgi:hypothetical protein
MGRVPPSEYTDKPRGGFSQIMEKLPDRTLLTLSTRDDPNATHDDIELSPTISDTEKLLQLQETMAARNSKSYYIFGSLLSTIGLIFSIVSMTSCSFAIVNWAIDGSTVAYQSTITHLGLFRWYNPKTSTCWAYNPTDDRFFYVDKAAQGLATSAVVFGGCAACIFGFVLLGNLISKCCGGRNINSSSNNSEGGGNKSNCCSKYNLNSTNNSITFFILSGLTLLASICQICTLTYFNMKNVEYEVTCNASADSSCVQGAGAHYTIIAFVMYLFGSGVFGFAGLGCWIVEMEKKKREGGNGNGGGEDDEEEEDNLPPPPPPAYPPPAALINGNSSSNGGRGSSGQQVIEGGPPPPNNSSDQPPRQQDDVSAAPSTFSARAYVSHGNGGDDEMKSV